MSDSDSFQYWDILMAASASPNCPTSGGREFRTLLRNWWTNKRSLWRVWQIYAYEILGCKGKGDSLSVCWIKKANLKKWCNGDFIRNNRNRTLEDLEMTTGEPLVLAFVVLTVFTFWEEYNNVLITGVMNARFINLGNYNDGKGKCQEVPVLSSLFIFLNNGIPTSYNPPSMSNQ